MSLRTSLPTFLAAQSAITAIVGSRIYPTRIPQGVNRPALVFRVAGSDEDHHSTGSTGLVMASVQIECQARTYKEAAELADPVRDALDGLLGDMAGLDVRGAMIDDERDSTVKAEDGSDLPFQAVLLDFDIPYRRS